MAELLITQWTLRDPMQLHYYHYGCWRPILAVSAEPCAGRTLGRSSTWHYFLQCIAQCLREGQLVWQCYSQQHVGILSFGFPGVWTCSHANGKYKGIIYIYILSWVKSYQKPTYWWSYFWDPMFVSVGRCLKVGIPNKGEQRLIGIQQLNM